MNILSRFIVPAMVVLGFSVPAARAAVVSTFNTGAEGWTVVSFSDLSASNYTVVGTYAPTYNATGGNPGGYISSTDPDGGDFTFSAPAAFLGNKTVALGTTFSYDLNDLEAVGYQTTDVMFVGNGVRLLWQSPTPLTPAAAFMNVSFLLSTSSAWKLNTTSGAQPTATDFQTVFSNLSGIYIRGEYAFGADNPGIDNVTLVPEPDTWALVTVALAAGAIVYRRQRCKATAA